MEPIAVIGMSCRFPGARDLAAFWQLLCHGMDAITEVPAERFDIDAIYDPRPGIPGKVCTRWGGFLEQIDQFDPYFFGISPREASQMDPQQRLLLEVAWEALEDAGQGLDKLAGSRTGIFIGMIYNDYLDLQYYRSNSSNIDIYTLTGGARSVSAGRLSYILALQGPNITIDTACSSSLVAVHLACQSLRNGESTLALAGGVNLILSLKPSLGFSQAKMLAPDGRCKAFDAQANGFVRSEGVGIVALKPLSLAQADGDPIYVVIRGSAVNNDGSSNGLLLAPSQHGQETVLREAYRNAGVSPGQVHYVETHGTGTSVGDPVEAKALGAVFATDRPKDRPCVIGSAKANIGHTEGAAGIAGLIKMALCLKYRAIPPSIHFHEPNPAIPWRELPLVVQRELGPWPMKPKPALAGVSSFGISGTNAHVVLEEAPQPRSLPEEAPLPKTHLLPLSAHSAEALEATVRAYQTFMVIAEEENAASLQDLCYTASVRRTHHSHRVAMVIHSRQELVEHLKAFLPGEVRPGMFSGRKIPGHQHKLVFVFPGQGSQWVGMGRELSEQEPVFREAIERCDRVMRQYIDWSLVQQLTAGEAQSRLHEVDVIQPSLFAMQVALAVLWRSWGVEPDAVVGQSMGEVAAAYIAGALSLEDAVRIICRRSQLIKSISGQGGMAVVGLSLTEAQQILVGYEERLSIAVSNSPSSTVLSGDMAALQEIRETLERQDIFCSLVNVDYSSHSPHMNPLRAAVLQALEGIQPQPASLPLYSTVLGAVSDGLAFDAAYWWRNLREPVFFSEAIQQLLACDHDIFLEISPHPIVSGAIQQGLTHSGHKGILLSSLRREQGERAVMLGSLGALYTLGYSINWSKLYPSGRRCVQLPPYPWQRERFWREEHETTEGRRLRFAAHHRKGGVSGHPFLGPCIQSAVHTNTYFWDIDVGIDMFPYLQDHQIQGLVVLPAAAFIEIVLAAAQEVFGPGPHVLEKVAFIKALFLPKDGGQSVQLVVSRDLPGAASFQFFSRQVADTGQQTSWTLHASGAFRLGRADPATVVTEHDSPIEIQDRCREVMSGSEYYQALQADGLEYGPSFQGMEQLWRQDGEAIGRVSPPDPVTAEANRYHVHPALLDVCFQILVATASRTDAAVVTGNPLFPVGLESVRLYSRPGAELWSHALLRSSIDSHTDILEGDVFLLDDNGQVVLEALGLRLRRLGRDAQCATDLSDWFYELQWEHTVGPQQDQTAVLPPPDQRGSWLIFTDSDSVGERLGALLKARGETCIMVSPGEAYRNVELNHYQLNPGRLEDFRQLLEEALGSGQPSCRGVVHLWSLEVAPPAATTLPSLNAAQNLSCSSMLHLIQALVSAGLSTSPRLWLITRGAQAVGKERISVSIGQAPLWGLGRTIAYEHPEFRCTKVDLSPACTPEEIRLLFQELQSDNQEDQIALRNTERYVARLVQRSPAVQRSPTAQDEIRRLTSSDEPFCLKIPTPGVLENLTLRASARQKPGPDEIEIRVYAVGLNFRDVMAAMGLIPSPFTLGLECTGTIVALGKNVEDFQVGDEVLACAENSFGAYVTAKACLVFPKPAQLTFEESVTIPVAFATAYYALYQLGRLRRGERVLIHAAAGGVGLAAVQLAQQAGAEIFATAGSPKKRAFLQSLGIIHVMDSRSLAFAEEVRERTNGEGVDVVLNSLAGDAIPKGLSTLRAFGRFVELGHRDIEQNTPLGLQLLQNNLSFFAIDLWRIYQEHPAQMGVLIRETMRFFEEGTLKPLPLQVFPISQVENAFRYMAQAKHVGKIVISLQDQDVLIAPSLEESAAIRPDSTYLITGGLGGLGTSIAQWMVQKGARHLVLIGRKGVSAVAQETLDAMKRAGAQVVIAKADVAQAQQLADVLANIGQSMPPLRGVIHAAGILEDSTLLQLNQESFTSVMAPKVRGAWNLHTLTMNETLDFFALFSSAASLLGSPGQGNYAAANAFLDALAHYRRARGLPAMSINWGPWAQVGLAARPDRGGRLALKGFVSMTPEQGVEAFGQLLQQDSVQVAVLPVNWRHWRRAYPIIGSSPLFTYLPLTHEGAAGDLGKRAGLYRDTLLVAEPGERQKLLEAHLSERVARVLGFSASKLSELDLHRPLNTLGLDSLMAVELKNWLQADFEVVVPIVNFLKGLSVAQLATQVLEQLESPLAPTTIAYPGNPKAPQIDLKTGISPEKAGEMLATLDQLSDAEVDDLLRIMSSEEEGKA